MRGLNLDSSNGQGTHWVCWYRDGDNKYYFDSYGLDPPIELVKYLQTPFHVTRIGCNRAIQ
jgi:hypothetical protein